jgi:hypothetical protein
MRWNRLLSHLADSERVRFGRIRNLDDVNVYAARALYREERESVSRLPGCDFHQRAVLSRSQRYLASRGGKCSRTDIPPHDRLAIRIATNPHADQPVIALVRDNGNIKDFTMVRNLRG